MAGADKRLYKQISQEGPTSDLEILSSPSSFFETSSLSRSPSALSNACSRKTLYYLKATLNTAYNPDYDFSNARSDEFRKEPSFSSVMHNVNVNLLTAIGERFQAMSSTLWQIIASEIDPDNVTDCEIYSYSPDTESDPFAEDGSLWSFNYFFYNKKLKRIVFFACRAASLSAVPPDEACSDEEVFAYEEEDSGMRDVDGINA